MIVVNLRQSKRSMPAIGGSSSVVEFFPSNVQSHQVCSRPRFFWFIYLWYMSIICICIYICTYV